MCFATHRCRSPPLIQSAGRQDVGMARMLTKNVLTSLHGTFGEGTLLYGMAFKLYEHAVCDMFSAVDFWQQLQGGVSE